MKKNEKKSLIYRKKNEFDMEHLKNFETFVNENYNVDESLIGNVRKFATGHESGADKETAKVRIEKEIDDLIEKYKPTNSGMLKISLLKQAAEDNYRGTVKPQRAAIDPKATSVGAGKIFLKYFPVKTGFQHAVEPIAAGTEVMAEY